MAQILRELTDGVFLLVLCYTSPRPQSPIALRLGDRSLRHDLQGVVGEFWAYPRKIEVLELFYFYPHPSSAANMEKLLATRATLRRKPNEIICGLDVRIEMENRTIRTPIRINCGKA